MSYLKERVAYLKGLAEGMKINDASNEGKMIKSVIDVLNDFATTMDNMEEAHQQLTELVNSMDDDLTEMESVVFDDESMMEDDECDECEEVEVECPYCNASINISEDMIDEETSTIKCPNCNKEIEVDWECSCSDHDDSEEDSKE